MTCADNKLRRTRFHAPLFVAAGIEPPLPPSTRFQGSKLKLLDWIWSKIGDLDFDSALDAFGGSACVSHFLKAKQKLVTFNDIMRWNCLCAQAIVANDTELLSEGDISRVFLRDQSRDYDNLVEREFHDVYFTDEENAWLDTVAQNIPQLGTENLRALAYYALFQAAISKRPYNLFHRKNLYMRLATVQRSFGNKATWDKAFDEHFRVFAQEANRAVFASGRTCSILNLDAVAVPGEYDLVYIDPPYVSAQGVGVDYQGFYHFLEGLATYPGWAARIDYRSKHRRLRPEPTPWTNPRGIADAFRDVFARFRKSILVISYRSDGMPSLEDLGGLLKSFKRNVVLHMLNGSYTYVLSKNRRSTEALLVGTD